MKLTIAGQQTHLQDIPLKHVERKERETITAIRVCAGFTLETKDQILYGNPGEYLVLGCIDGPKVLSQEEFNRDFKFLEYGEHTWQAE